MSSLPFDVGMCIYSGNWGRNSKVGNLYYVYELEILYTWNKTYANSRHIFLLGRLYSAAAA